MPGRSQAPRIAPLVAALGLAAALGCSAAQAGSSTRLEVSATILTRITCNYAGASDAQPDSRCSSSDPRTTYRVRKERDPRAGAPNPSAAGAYANHVVLVVEP